MTSYFGFSRNDIAGEVESLHYAVSDEKLDRLIQFMERRHDASIGMNWDRMQDLIVEWCQEHKVRRVLRGRTEVYLHPVSWWFDILDLDVDEQMEKQLADDAESRAREMIQQGCSCGELNTLYTVGDEDHELSGWWKVDHDPPGVRVL